MARCKCSKPGGIPWAMLTFLVNFVRMMMVTWQVLHGPPPTAVIHFAGHIAHIAVITMVVLQGFRL